MDSENTTTVQEKPKRYRRTRVVVEEAIQKAAINQVLQCGFMSSQVTGIMKGAKIEPPVFYHRYKDLDAFYSDFVKQYDYWFCDIVNKAMKDNNAPEAQFRALMAGLQNALRSKSVMQELLRWEVAEGNDTTNRTATLREMYTLPLADKYNALFDGTGIDFIAFTALLIGGLYYLHLHKERSTFCAIDMTKEEGIERIRKAIDSFTDIMFSYLEQKNAMQDAAQRLREKGVDEQTIKECLQL